MLKAIFIVSVFLSFEIYAAESWREKLLKGDASVLVGKVEAEIPKLFKNLGGSIFTDDNSKELGFGVFESEELRFAIITETKGKDAKILAVQKIVTAKKQSYSTLCTNGKQPVVAITSPKSKSQKSCDGSFRIDKAWVFEFHTRKFAPIKPNSVVCDYDDYSVCDD